MWTSVSRNLNPHASDRLFRVSDNVAVVVLLQVAFWLGVVVTMLVYQVGFLEAVR